LRKITPTIPIMTMPNLAANTIPTSASGLRGARFVISGIDEGDIASEWIEAPVVSRKIGIVAVMVARNRREKRMMSFMLVFEFVFLFWGGRGGGLKCKWYA
jgi:hypothetical protein